MDRTNLKVTFFSNYLTHHQIPLCNYMYQLFGDNYTFVCTERIEEERLRLGYEDLNTKYPYTLNTYESIENYNRALELGYTSDIVIMGSGPKVFIEKRLSEDKLTYYWMERIFKKGFYQILSPYTILELLKYHARYNSKKLYILCSSAYTAFDFYRLGLHRGKMYNWGYFPEAKIHDIDKLIGQKRSEKVKLLWMGRFLDWKHPDDVVTLAHRLKSNGIDFQLDIVGTGELKTKIQNMIKKFDLKDCVTLKGSVSPKEARKYMEDSSIHLFTSDFNEGWGAVLNETMNSGCAVVASHAIGSVPLMIEHEKNGLIYKNGDIGQLYDFVVSLVEDQSLRERLGKKAYNTTIDTWNAAVAVDRLLNISENLLDGYQVSYSSGPCSKADIYSHEYRL